jgi:hypothetical protein
VAFLTCHMVFGLEYLAVLDFFLCASMCLFGPLLCELSCCFRRFGSYGRTSTYSTFFEPFDDELEHDRSTLGFWGER